jgi:cytochrome oxidase Cu insertion factor (SCO1/SenC/PrrC family)
MKHLYLKTQRSFFTGLTLSLVACALAFIPVQAQNETSHHHGQTPAKKTRHARQTYSCPMHPEVTSKSKGKCPKCKMDLRPADQKVDRKEATTDAGSTSHEAVTLTPPFEVAKASSSDQSSKMHIPDVELLDQNGRKIHFYTDLVKGQTVVINFIFTTCTTICPPLGATFARVQKELGDKAGRDVRFISISVDPATDTPERLKAWGAKFHAGDGWTFVTGNKPDVDELLRALGASSARREDHSPTVLIGNDAHGNWTRTYGLANTSKLVQIINEVMEGKAATTAADGQ